MSHYILRSFPVRMKNYMATLVIMSRTVSLVLFHFHRLSFLPKPNEPFINVLVFVVPREIICMFVSFNTFITGTKMFYQWWISSGILCRKNKIIYLQIFLLSEHMIRDIIMTFKKQTQNSYIQLNILFIQVVFF